MCGSILCRLWHGQLAQNGLAAVRNERTGRPVYNVWPGGQRRKVTHNDLPAQSVTGGDVGGGHGAEVHGGGRLVSSENLKEDTLPRIWSGTKRGFHDDTPPTHAWDQDRNQLESDASQPDSTPTPGVKCDLSAENEAVALPLPRMPGILPQVERPALSLQQASLGGSDKDPGGSPQTPT